MNNHFKGILITAIGVLLMSLESLFIKLTSISSLTFAFYVGILMMLSLNIILFKTHKSEIINIYKSDWVPIFICGLLLGTSNLFFINAIKTTTVANTVMILASAPLFSALYAYMLYKTRSSKNIFIASFFIFIGLFIIFSSQLDSKNLWGNLYAFGCVNLYSLGFVVLSQYKHANRIAIMATAGMATFLISSLFIDTLFINLYTIMILLCVGLLVTPISRILMGIGTKHLPASEVSLLMIIETIMAPLWVWFFLQEVPAITTFIGGAIILLTLFINALYVIRYKPL